MLRTNFDAKTIGVIAGIWFQLAIKGEVIYFPSTKWELRAYILRNNSLFQLFIQLCMLLIFLSPIFSASTCYEMNSASDIPLELFVIFSSMAYLFDSFLFFSSTHWMANQRRIGNSQRGDQRHRWFMAGILSSTLILLNQIAHAAATSDQNVHNVCKCLFVVSNFYLILHCIYN